jgi:SAM-dependent methyltransferase
MWLARHKRDWEELAEVDLFWAIISDPNHQFGHSDIESFLDSGRAEIGELMAQADAYGLPENRRRALDFGCGAGRLTRALSLFFNESVGVDISERMVDASRRLHSDVPNCVFLVNTEDNLRLFDDDEFDLVYSSIVLQHLPKRRLILSYIAEFVRALSPGGLLAFQVASFVPFKHRLQPRRRTYRALRALGIPPDFLYGKLGLHPIRMSFVPVKDTLKALEVLGAHSLDVVTVDAGNGVRSSMYYATK